MKYTAKHRFADVSARKIRLFANLVRGRNVDDALQLLRFYPNRGAKLLMAVIESAYGNADHLECPEPDELVLAECRVDGAPMFKRIQPRARGTAFQIKRRMAHIIVSLVDPEDLVKETPEELKTTTQETGGTPSTPALPAAT
jgi:large subunit ribosomal protein L22